MWKRMRMLFHQANKVKKFLLDTEIEKLPPGWQEYYRGFLTLWTERNSCYFTLSLLIPFLMP